jgi:hypothetical protein
MVLIFAIVRSPRLFNCRLEGRLLPRNDSNGHLPLFRCGIDDPVFNWFPEYPELRTEKERISPRHLLTISARDIPYSDSTISKARMRRRTAKPGPQVVSSRGTLPRDPRS